MGAGDGAGLGVEEEVRLVDGLGGVEGAVGQCLLGEEVCSDPEESDSVSLLDDGGGGGGESRGTWDTGAASGGGASVSGFMSSSSRAPS